VPLNIGKSTPQVALLAQLLGHGAPNKPTNLYQHDFPSMLAAFLGVPVRTTNLNTARLDKLKEDKPAR